MAMPQKYAIIIGAGPAGLTAAYELLARSDILPIVLEKSTYMGGIARTHNYKGNRIDLGGHRFFSKSERVMQWWADRIPLQPVNGPEPDRERPVMLVRRRKSRIYFLRKFFDYPIRPDLVTLSRLGFVRLLRILSSYLKVAIFPPRQVANLEQFFISRFGRELYLTFFKSYTEKVWGVPCHQISAQWGAQRIKGLSITRAALHFARQVLCSRADIAQKDVETSLIQQFLYPRFGPGQMWNEVAREVCRLGGQIFTEWNAESLEVSGDSIVSVTARHASGAVRVFEGSYFFSTMPVQELLGAMRTPVPAKVREVSDGLVYRDFITVGLLLNKLNVCDPATCQQKLISDNWIYIQEPDVIAGRLQIFNNWSPDMVAEPSKVWVGVEYFCYQTDALWSLSDREMSELAITELDKIGIIKRGEVIDSTVLRMPKTYPAYFGTYARFDRIREYIDGFPNLFLVGRNGMHKYNNQDHSMLTAMVAVDNILAECTDKANIWDVNTDMEYQEEKKQAHHSKAYATGSAKHQAPSCCAVIARRQPSRDRARSSRR